MITPQVVMCLINFKLYCDLIKYCKWQQAQHLLKLRACVYK